MVRRQTVTEWAGRAVACSLFGAAIGGAGCVRPHSQAPLAYADDLEQGVAEVGSLLYVRQLASIERTPLHSDEWGAVTLDPGGNRLFSAVGRQGELVAIDRDTARIQWVKDLSGAVSMAPLLVDPRTLLVGTDDGTLWSLRTDSGDVAWRYETVGTVRNEPLVHDDVVYFVNSRDQVFALDARTGGWRWQYERDLPPGFTIRGRAGLTFIAASQLGPHQLSDDIGVLFTGFADGRVAALSASSGQALWLADLAPAGETEFVDVDTTPVLDLVRGEVLASGQAGGVFGLALSDGEVRWTLPVAGAGAITRLDVDAFLVSSSLDGLVAFEPGGRVRWRRQLDVGVVGRPVVVAERIYVPHSESGVLVYGAARGNLLGLIDVRSGVSGGIVVDDRAQQLFVTTNRGALLAFQLPRE
ncbi:MAG: hypothetical protein B7733_13865 [Myxococcales bacterium FL481]|nr:MAG: hypothetical protein B7733_13865 [Myxococcales bacterium FL481]